MYALNKVKYFMDKIFWLQPEDSQLGKWQRQLEDVSKSHSFCVLPWIHLATRPNGDMRICCVANASGADTGDYTCLLYTSDAADE